MYLVTYLLTYLVVASGDRDVARRLVSSADVETLFHFYVLIYNRVSIILSGYF